MSSAAHDHRAVLVAGTASDAHTWNLIFLQLYAEERGHVVRNLGPCVPPDLLVAECLAERPSVVVLSSVNGHGELDALRAITALRANHELAGLPAVVGGKLGVRGGSDPGRVARLLAAGFDAVYDDGALTGFAEFLAAAAKSITVPS